MAESLIIIYALGAILMNVIKVILGAQIISGFLIVEVCKSERNKRLLDLLLNLS